MVGGDLSRTQAASTCESHGLQLVKWNTLRKWQDVVEIAGTYKWWKNEQKA